jgi:hypothetical protein
MPDESTLLGAIISVLIAWSPYFFLIGVWVYGSWRMGMFGRGAMTQSRFLEEVMSETRRQNAMLAALLTKIDARLSQLEAGGRDAKKLDA